MPGLGGRIETLTKAKISHLLDRAEDPAETLDYAYEQQMEDLQKVKQGIEGVVTAKKRLQMQEEQLKQQSDKLDGQAREAMSAGREDLARAAIERKQLITQEVSSLDQQVADLESQQQKLIDSERNLQTKIEQFRTKKEVIKAQYSASEAQVQISEAATGIGDHMADLGEAMQRAIDKTDQMQARASAVEELQSAGTFDDLTSLGPPQDDIDKQLDQIGAKSSVDDEMAKLKAELGSGAKPDAPQIGTGDTSGAAPETPPAGAGDAAS
jgi:phage shock protein A